MKNITPKIIELAKAIAELCRLPVEVGTWVLHGGLIKLVYKKDGQFINVIIGYEKNKILTGDVIPIPDIGDCLEKLLELGYESMNLLRRPFKYPWMSDIWDAESHDLDADTIKRWDNKGKTLHETLLSTLLKVLKNE